MSTPTVSVVMAAYNGAGLIEETLASLAAQTLTDWEAIVVDDCSTDDTREVVARWRDPRVRLVALAENGGPVRARNRGVVEARGRYIAGLDHDDIALPERFARQVAYLDAHPGVALVGTGVDFLRDGRVRPSTYPVNTNPALIGWLTWIENPLAWSSVMIRGDVARALDPFTRPELVYAEDFDLYHRVRPHGGLARLDQVLLRYRQHPGGVSKRFADQMGASATRVLAEAHADLLGDEAVGIAALIVAHHLDGRAVPDRTVAGGLPRPIRDDRRRTAADRTGNCATMGADRACGSAHGHARPRRRSRCQAAIARPRRCRADRARMVTARRPRPERAGRSDLGGEDHAPRAERREHLIEVALADREAALAAAEHPV